MTRGQRCVHLDDAMVVIALCAVTLTVFRENPGFSITVACVVLIAVARVVAVRRLDTKRHGPVVWLQSTAAALLLVTGSAITGAAGIILIWVPVVNLFTPFVVLGLTGYAATKYRQALWPNPEGPASERGITSKTAGESAGEKRRDLDVDVFDEIVWMFSARGSSPCLSECVTQTEHALQTAHQAELSGATPCLIVSALLHDIGHILDECPYNPSGHAFDSRHEAIGEAWLAELFGPDVAGPAGLHVAAKRFLCSVDPSYHLRLSTASVQSLVLQGGPMSGDEAMAFLAKPYSEAAVRLRYWDDGAKKPGWPVPGLEHYRLVVRETARRAVQTSLR